MKIIEINDQYQKLNSEEVARVNVILDRMQRTKIEVCDVAERLLFQPGFEKTSAFLTRSYQSYCVVSNMVETRLPGYAKHSAAQSISLADIAEQTNVLLEESKANSRMARMMTREARKMSGDASKMTDRRKASATPQKSDRT